jgi:hypothetical protein
MGIELKDFRGRITPEADCVLEAEARVTGKDRQEIVREILHAWAMERIHGASVLNQLLRAEGLRGIDCGTRGKMGEAEGTRGIAA